MHFKRDFSLQLSLASRKRLFIYTDTRIANDRPVVTKWFQAARRTRKMSVVEQRRSARTGGEIVGEEEIVVLGIFSRL